MPSESQRSPRKSKGQRQRNAGKKQSQSNKQQQQQQQQQQSPNKKQVDSHIVANKTKCLNQLDQKSDKDHIKVTASSCNVPSVSNQPDETVTTEANDRLRDTDGNTAAIISQQITGRSPTKLDPLSEALSTIDLMLKNPGLPATQLSAEITVSVPTNIRHNEPNDELGNESKILEQCEARENLRGPSQANSVKHVSSHATSSSYHKALRLDKRVISKIEVDDEYLEEVDIADDVVKNLACDPEETSSYSRDADLQAQVDLGKVNLGYKTDEANSSSSSSSSSSVSTSSSSAQAAKKAQCDRVNFSPEYYSPPRQSVDQYCSLKISTESSPGRKSIDEDVNHSSSSSSFTRTEQQQGSTLHEQLPSTSGHQIDVATDKTVYEQQKQYDEIRKKLELKIQAQNEQIQMLVDQAQQQADKMSGLEAALISTNRTCHQLEAMLKQELSKRSSLESDSRNLMNEINKLRAQIAASEQIKMRDDEKISLLNATLMERETEVSILKLKLTRATTSASAATLGGGPQATRPTSQAMTIGSTGKATTNNTIFTESDLYGSIRRPTATHRTSNPSDGYAMTSYSQHSTPQKRVPARRFDAFDTALIPGEGPPPPPSSSSSPGAAAATVRGMPQGVVAMTADTTVITSSPLTRDRRYRTLPSRSNHHFQTQLTDKTEIIHTHTPTNAAAANLANDPAHNDGRNITNNAASLTNDTESNSMNVTRSHRSHSNATATPADDSLSTNTQSFRVTDLDDRKSPVSNKSQSNVSNEHQKGRPDDDDDTYDVVTHDTTTNTIHENQHTNNDNRNPSPFYSNNNAQSTNNELPLASHYATMLNNDEDIPLPVLQARPTPATPTKQASGLRRIFSKLRRTGSSARNVVDSDDESTPEMYFKRGGVARNTTHVGVGSSSSGVSGPMSLHHQGGQLPNCSSKPFAEWDTNLIADWLTMIGLSMYSNQCKRWVKSGAHLMNATSAEVERGLGISNSLHRKKLRLAISELNDDCDKITKAAANLDYLWVARWLDDIGLSQYKEAFINARIDGRVLNYLTVDDLANMQITSVLHHASIRCGIRVLRSINFDLQALRRRATAAEIDSMQRSGRTVLASGGIGGSLTRQGTSGSITNGNEQSSTDNQRAPAQADVALWTCHRVMEWLRTIDLSEFAPNLRGSGVHGGLIVYEDGFNADLLSTLLSVPDDKTLLRRHIYTLFKELIGTELAQQKRQYESMPNYTPLSPTAEIKVPRKSQFSSLLRRKSSKVGQNNLEVQYLCPMFPMDRKVLQEFKAKAAEQTNKLYQQQQEDMAQQQQQRQQREVTAANV